MRLSYAAAPAAPSAQTAAVNGDRDPEGAQRRGEADAIGEHETRKGRGADRMREEREPAQHDPGAEDAGAER